MRSHIEDIIGLIDNVLGPDDGGPVPTWPTMNARPTIPTHHIPITRRGSEPRIQSSRGPVSVHALRNMSFEDLVRFLGDRSERTLAHNTRIFRRGDNYGIVLHATEILTFWREPASDLDGTPRTWAFSLNSGGYETTTTKQRMNALMPPGYRISARKFYWYVDTPTGTVAFRDGVTFTV